MAFAAQVAGRALRSVAPIVEPSAVPALSSLQHGAALSHMLTHVLTGMHTDDPSIPRGMLVLTGAGISTASGIPDYRSPGRPAYKPLNHADFIAQSHTRTRYWARSFLGWPRMRTAAPNAGHYALARLQALGVVTHIITQNVDRLHLASGSPLTHLTELHGTIHEVECLECRSEETRETTQRRMQHANTEWVDRWMPHAVPRPDGDVELPGDAYSSFNVPTCHSCGARVLKPKVVFHGGSVPQHVTQRALELAENASALLLVGTSATVFSAFRIVRAVAAAGKPIGIINYGPTRADELANFKLDMHINPALVSLVREAEARLGVAPELHLA